MEHLRGILDRVEDFLTSAFPDVNTPWIIQQILDFISQHPATTGLLLLIVILFAVFTTTRGIKEGQRRRAELESLGERFPRERWEYGGQLDATAIFLDAIRVFGVSKNLVGVGVHYGNLGILYFQRGSAQDAERMLTKALQLFEAINCREGIAFYSRHLSSLYREKGDWDRAIAMAERSQEMYQAIGVAPNFSELEHPRSLKKAAEQAGSEDNGAR